MFLFLFHSLGGFFIPPLLVLRGLFFLLLWTRCFFEWRGEHHIDKQHSCSKHHLWPQLADVVFLSQFSSPTFGKISEKVPSAMHVFSFAFLLLSCCTQLTSQFQRVSRLVHCKCKFITCSWVESCPEWVLFFVVYVSLVQGGPGLSCRGGFKAWKLADLLLEMLHQVTGGIVSLKRCCYVIISVWTLSWCTILHHNFLLKIASKVLDTAL